MKCPAHDWNNKSESLVRIQCLKIFILSAIDAIMSINIQNMYKKSGLSSGLLKTKKFIHELKKTISVAQRAWPHFELFHYHYVHNVNMMYFFNKYYFLVSW